MDLLDRKTKFNPCPLCRDGVHTREQHKKDYFREYNYKRNEGKVSYRRGYHKSRFEDVKDFLKTQE